VKLLKLFAIVVIAGTLLDALFFQGAYRHAVAQNFLSTAGRLAKWNWHGLG
jgi:hypothetical protein